MTDEAVVEPAAAEGPIGVRGAEEPAAPAVEPSPPAEPEAAAAEARPVVEPAPSLGSEPEEGAAVGAEDTAPPAAEPEPDVGEPEPEHREAEEAAAAQPEVPEAVVGEEDLPPIEPLPAPPRPPTGPAVADDLPPIDPLPAPPARFLVGDDLPPIEPLPAPPERRADAPTTDAAGVVTADEATPPPEPTTPPEVAAAVADEPADPTPQPATDEATPSPEPGTDEADAPTDPTLATVPASTAAPVAPAAAGMSGPERTRPWLRAYPPGVPETYRYPLVPLTRFLDDAAQDFPDTVAVEYLGAHLTYRQLLERADRFATALTTLGVRAGDHVALLLPSCPQALIALNACWRIGAVAVPLPPDVPADVLEDRLRRTAAPVVITVDAAYATLAALKGRIASVAHVVVTRITDPLPALRRVLTGRRRRTAELPADEGLLTFTGLLDEASAGTPQATVDVDRHPAAVLGPPGAEPVTLTHLNLVAAAFQARLWIPDVQAGRERLLVAAPPHDPVGLSAGLNMGVLSAATLVLPADADGAALVKAIDGGRPTLVVGSLDALAAAAGDPSVRRADLTSPRVLLLDAPTHRPDLLARLEDLTGARVRTGLGDHRCGGLTHANPVYAPAIDGSVGLPLPDVDQLVVDLDRRTPTDGPGELLVAGPQCAREALSAGWVATGWYAQPTEHGAVCVWDRVDALLEVGGHRVAPGQVARVLRGHRGVADARVGLATDQGSAELVGEVLLAEGHDLDEHALAAWCRDALPSAAVPTRWRIIAPAAPSTPGGPAADPAAPPADPSAPPGAG